MAEKTKKKTKKKPSMPRPPRDTVTWTEVCQKVNFGDGLYSTCREKVADYPAGGPMRSPGGFRGGALDEVPGRDSGPDFDAELSRSALKIPDPPSKTDLAKYPPGYGQEPEFFGMPLNRILMYGGVALLVWFLLGKRQQIAVGTETDAAPAKPEVTPTKAA